MYNTHESEAVYLIGLLFRTRNSGRRKEGGGREKEGPRKKGKIRAVGYGTERMGNKKNGWMESG